MLEDDLNVYFYVLRIDYSHGARSDRIGKLEFFRNF